MSAPPARRACQRTLLRAARRRQHPGYPSAIKAVPEVASHSACRTFSWRHKRCSPPWSHRAMPRWKWQSGRWVAAPAEFLLARALGGLGDGCHNSSQPRKSHSDRTASFPRRLHETRHPDAVAGRSQAFHPKNLLPSHVRCALPQLLRRNRVRRQRRAMCSPAPLQAHRASDRPTAASDFPRSHDKRGLRPASPGAGSCGRPASRPHWARWLRLAA